MDKYSNLLSALRNMGNVLVAFSGGVDSSFLLAAAKEALGYERVVAVTASSELLTPRELEEAKCIAEQIGVRHLVVPVADLQNEEFVVNDAERCYHCKKYRFQKLQQLAKEMQIQWVIDGSNRDDLSDYRPGNRAIKELGIRSPLEEAGLAKHEIRSYAKKLGLSVWNKPSKPCVATRIPYGTSITADSLKRIMNAEEYLIDLLGEEQIRVREHGNVARLEVPRGIFTKIIDESVSISIYNELKRLGYSYVALDIIGYRLGSMNEELKE